MKSNTQNKTSIKKTVILLFMVFVTITSSASIYIDIPINQQISNSELILRGIVTNKSSKYENMIREYSIMTNGVVNKSRVSATTPYTTFTVKLEEVLLGTYKNKEIEVKMEGGCGEDGKCLNVSSNYNYEIGDEIVIFLNYDKNNSFYISSDAGLTAFKVSPSNELYRTGEYATFEKNSLVLKKETNKRILSLMNLKISIDETVNAK